MAKNTKNVAGRWHNIETIVKSVQDPKTFKQNIMQAAEVIKSGGLVAFPTETVYGLGANALDNEAAGKIYFAKGRPADNPLIVHIDKNFDIERIARDVPAGARLLMDAFWPGPLTLVLKSRAGVFSYGHMDTVALRMPKHLKAQLLIHHSGVPIAAPSANISGRPSPTTADHVLADLGGKIDMILDDGACQHGVESTVIDFSESTPKLLRPGSITLKMIENAIGKVAVAALNGEEITPKSPGTKYRHYSPKGKLTLVIGEPQISSAKILEMLQNSTSKSPIILAPTANKDLYANVPFIGLGRRDEEIAANIYAVLRRCDDDEHDEIFVQGVEEKELGVAIMNRLKKAAGANVLEV
ncbi:MAG: L-threonylcarbamoyladenylate synthase [Defluviitaleaceae bacterium]|nr:L-threonylcarbamoyladenylate synthase [Defluviitaleaceae bacterium]